MVAVGSKRALTDFAVHPSPAGRAVTLKSVDLVFAISVVQARHGFALVDFFIKNNSNE